MVRQRERSEGTIAAILEAARKLFATRGFEETTIDDIAAGAAVAKGAVYHHFRSKEEIFERVFDQLLTKIAADVSAMAAVAGRDPIDLLVRGTQGYLELVSAPSARRILLIDGPAVLGWNRWRETDLRHFGAGTRALLKQVLRPTFSDPEVDAVLHLLAGAITEAAFVSASARDRAGAIANLVSGLRFLLAGLNGARLD